ncbi:subunit of efflux permease exporting the starvation-induced killing protein (ATP-binding protein) [Petrocella atlantisensis]|uniref:Subunit of efflux permease exporting the starvation-induced killing protein (ATP-binding protein) n=2 Tax=Petrocella atlantisensis TaxID=2173034 RepID=A0A3P7S798_9FIRM|nr:subunit of efflux permease exporting the starvation-induced killing protein (ATP-binding protein) [Petrocella atlantisensis]
MKTIIEMTNIKKSYKMGDNILEVLKGIDLSITEGEFVAILGPSGSGKSTIMNIMGCIDAKSQGKYLLDGKNIENFSEDELAIVRNDKIGFVFQKFNLLPRLSTLNNVEMPILLRGGSSKEAKTKAKVYLDMVGLGDRMHHKPIELSGGQQQRVAIARALVGEPELILADEPTGNLDQTSGKEIMALFKKLNDEGNTIVMITHDEKIASQAKRVIRIVDGLIEPSFIL